MARVLRLHSSATRWSRRLALRAFATALLAGTVGFSADASAAEGAPPLRIALVRGNLAQAERDPVSGEYRGVSMDVARELGRRWGRTVEVSQLSPAAILEAVANGTVELGFVAPNPERMGTVAYAQTYMLVLQTAIVPDASPMRSVEELDRPGRRIGVNTGDSVAVYLARTLRQAKLVDSPDMTMAQPLAWLQDGTVAAFAGNRQRLGAAIRNVKGLHLLPDNIYAVPQAIAVSPGRPDLLTTVNVALDEMRSSGFLTRAVAASGVDGIAVAPATGVTPDNPAP